MKFIIIFKPNIGSLHPSIDTQKRYTILKSRFKYVLWNYLDMDFMEWVPGQGGHVPAAGGWFPKWGGCATGP